LARGLAGDIIRTGAQGRGWRKPGDCPQRSQRLPCRNTRNATSTGDPMVVRISKGRYEAELHVQVTARLNESGATLIPAIRSMQGCLSYFAGSDEASGTMINVSVWDTLEHAQAMAALPEMAALARQFIAMGVEFERPIVNYPVLWSVPAA
jgi:quinol monooxygenase YgiN